MAKKSCIIAIITLTLTCAFLVQATTNAQVTSYHTNNAEINYIEFTLTIHRPNSNKIYYTEMPLNFSINWNRYPTFSGLPSPPAPPMIGAYSYSIDNQPSVNLTSIESPSDIYDRKGFKTNPTFLSIIDISKLTQGTHSIVITANIHSTGSISFTDSSTPINFTVEKNSAASDLSETTSPNPTPTPTVPELSLLVTIPLMMSLLSIALLLRHRKTSN